MENVKPKKHHGINVDSRSRGTVTGVEKVISSCDTSLVLITGEGGLTVTGKDLKINKFDDEEGTLTYEGTTDCVRYTAKKVPILKRLFK